MAAQNASMALWPAEEAGTPLSSFSRSLAAVLLGTITFLAHPQCKKFPFCRQNSSNFTSSPCNGILLSATLVSQAIGHFRPSFLSHSIRRTSLKRSSALPVCFTAKTPNKNCSASATPYRSFPILATQSRPSGQTPSDFDRH